MISRIEQYKKKVDKVVSTLVPGVEYLDRFLTENPKGLINPARSDHKLMKIYESLHSVLKETGHVDITHHPIKHFQDAVYPGFSFKPSISSTLDVGYRKSSDLRSIERVIEVRAGTKDIAKNAHNNFLNLVGKQCVVNRISQIELMKAGIFHEHLLNQNYFSAVSYVDINDPETDKALELITGASLYLGLKAFVIPYTCLYGNVEIDLTRVPYEVSLLKFFNIEKEVYDDMRR